MTSAVEVTNVSKHGFWLQFPLVSQDNLRSVP